MKLKSLPLIHRLNLIVVIALAGVLAVALIALYEFRSQIRADQVRALGGLVDAAQGTMSHYHALERGGVMSRRQAQEAAAAVLRRAPTGTNGYVVVNDRGPIMIVHPVRPELEGHDVGDYRDPTGRYLFRELVAAAGAKGGGVVDYMWSSGTGSVPRPRLAFAKTFEPWDWVVSSSIYTDDADAATQGLLYRLAAAVGALAVVLLLVVRRVGHSITVQVGGEPAYAAGIARRVAKGDLRVPVEVASDDRESVLAVLAKVLARLRGRPEPDSGPEPAALREIETASWPVVALAAQRRSLDRSGIAAVVKEMIADAEGRPQGLGGDARPSPPEEPPAAEDTKVSGEHGTITITVDQAAETIRQLVGRANEIASTADTIKAIAAQTNLIAINAVIDAARAGERGRELGGAADRVRGLAERTVSATSRIEQMVCNIRSATDGAIEEMSRFSGQATQGAKPRQTAEPQRELPGAVAGSGGLERIRDVTEAAGARSAAPSSVARQIEQVARMIEGTGASMRSAVAAVAELERLASELREMVSRFRR